MGKSKDQILAEIQGPGVQGDTAPSRDPNDPRRYRLGQGSGRSSLRFNQDQFETDGDRVSLRERPQPLTKIDLIRFVNREADMVDGTIALDAGLYTGPGHLDNTDESSATWVLPTDMDRSQKAVLTLGIAQDGTVSGSNTLTMEIFAYVPGTNGATLLAAPTQTETATITATTTTADDHAAEFTMSPTLCFTPDVTAIMFRAVFTTKNSASTDFVMHHAQVEYTTRYYHTHERVN